MKIFNYYVYFDIINSCNNRGVATNNGLGGEGGGGEQVQIKTFFVLYVNTNVI